MKTGIYPVIPQMGRWIFNEHGLPNTCSLDFRKANVEMHGVSRLSKNKSMYALKKERLKRNSPK